VKLSGPEWCREFPTERTTAGLRPPFRGKVQRFITSLEAGGVAVRVVATRRPAERAYLMHWAWRIAREGFDPRRVPARAGVDIQWWHGELGASRSAAAAMVSAYGLAYKPSLTSHHIAEEGEGALAIDMDVTWSGVVKVLDANGDEVELDAAKGNEANPVLHRVGASFGVYKLVKDPPHWSVDGR
jgi:hypothetical protein